MNDNNTQTAESQSTTNTVTCDNAAQVMRLAKQRQSTEDYEAGVPDETHVEGSVDSLFDDDGQLLPADTVEQQSSDHPSSLSEWLKEVNADRHAKWQKAVENNMFPDMTDEELLNHCVQNEIEDAEADGRDISPDVVDDVPHLVISTQQNMREDIWGAVDAEEEESDGQECPECGSTNTSSYQQQTGGADEGMTSFHKCADCSNSWRGGYAS